MPVTGYGALMGLLARPMLVAQAVGPIGAAKLGAVQRPSAEATDWLPEISTLPKRARPCRTI